MRWYFVSSVTLVTLTSALKLPAGPLSVNAEKTKTTWNGRGQGSISHLWSSCWELRRPFFRYIRSAHAALTIFPTVKCVVSDWSSWSSCSTTSGLGNQERTRRVIEEPNLNGIDCPELTETRWCQPGHHSNIRKIKTLKNTQERSWLAAKTMKLATLTLLNHIHPPAAYLTFQQVSHLFFSFAWLLLSEVRAHYFSSCHYTSHTCCLWWLRSRMVHRP